MFDLENVIAGHDSDKVECLMEDLNVQANDIQTSKQLVIPGC